MVLTEFFDMPLGYELILALILEIALFKGIILSLIGYEFAQVFYFSLEVKLGVGKCVV